MSVTIPHLTPSTKGMKKFLALPTKLCTHILDFLDPPDWLNLILVSKDVYHAMMAEFSLRRSVVLRCSTIYIIDLASPLARFLSRNPYCPLMAPHACDMLTSITGYPALVRHVRKVVYVPRKPIWDEKAFNPARFRILFDQLTKASTHQLPNWKKHLRSMKADLDRVPFELAACALLIMLLPNVKEIYQSGNTVMWNSYQALQFSQLRVFKINSFHHSTDTTCLGTMQHILCLESLEEFHAVGLHSHENWESDEGRYQRLLSSLEKPDGPQLGVQSVFFTDCCISSKLLLALFSSAKRLKHLKYLTDSFPERRRDMYAGGLWSDRLSEQDTEDIVRLYQTFVHSSKDRLRAGKFGQRIFYHDSSPTVFFEIRKGVELKSQTNDRNPSSNPAEMGRSLLDG